MSTILQQFSQQSPYYQSDIKLSELLSQLDEFQEKLNFPTLKRDVGLFMSFIVQAIKPRTIFEFGSGYGHSSYWYFHKGHDFIDKVQLTERRTDLQDYFERGLWPKEWLEKIDYFQGDAFQKLESYTNIDFLLIDGQKSSYQDFLEASYDKLSSDAYIFIDNSFWRGDFLDSEKLKKKSVMAIKELHDYISQSTLYESIFIPFEDGVSLLKKL